MLFSLWRKSINTILSKYICVYVYKYICIYIYTQIIVDRLVGWAEYKLFTIYEKNAEQNNIINIQAYRDHFSLLKMPSALCIKSHSLKISYFEFLNFYLIKYVQRPEVWKSFYVLK